MLECFLGSVGFHGLKVQLSLCRAHLSSGGLSYSWKYGQTQDSRKGYIRVPTMTLTVGRSSGMTIPLRYACFRR